MEVGGQGNTGPLWFPGGAGVGRGALRRRSHAARGRFMGLLWSDGGGGRA